jgi:hypothetical protein
VDNNRIKRFGAHLPLAENLGKTSRFGTRHRAALGLSERTDALIVVVSEEKGTISVAEGGDLITLDDPRELENRIASFMKENIVDDNRGGVWQYLIKRHLWSKVAAGLLAILAWFFFIYQSGVATKQVVVPVELRSIPAGLQVSQIVPKEVRVNVSGNYRDIRSLNDNTIKTSIDLSGATVGEQPIYLQDSNLDYPNYLSLINLTPRRVSVTLEPVIK